MTVSMDQRLIVIAGFMGSGKTTVARALTDLLGWEAQDLDESISREEQRSPKEIIEQDGEDRFREIETQALSELLKRNSAGVVALGGGTWTVPANRKLLADIQRLRSGWMRHLSCVGNGSRQAGKADHWLLHTKLRNSVTRNASVFMD